MMKWLSLILLSMVVATSAGCISTPRYPGSGFGEKTKEIIKETQGALWPFYTAGFACILGGAAMIIIFKDFRLLLIGIGIAFIPPMVIMFLAPIAVLLGWIAVGTAGLGAAYIGYLLFLRARQKKRESEFLEHSKT